MEKKNGTKNNKIDITMLLQLLTLYLQQQIELNAYELESVKEWNTKHEEGNGIVQFEAGKSCFDEDFSKEWL
jgi:hypothetical protein